MINLKLISAKIKHHLQVFLILIVLGYVYAIYYFRLLDCMNVIFATRTEIKVWSQTPVGNHCSRTPTVLGKMVSQMHQFALTDKKKSIWLISAVWIPKFT